ncbi:hypothetical protein SCHPADRAFT_934926 [Schizopora paradoxa]|uniref:Uncharacterized protein n=1 Tax=Schizopora paradoxa TaxID=27342 RepID=A0A0H2S6B9_9AGAM|nr:hypothetical protein SCHPADRAFT_934926 [Schizopora paradoxa]
MPYSSSTGHLAKSPPPYSPPSSSSAHLGGGEPPTYPRQTSDHIIPAPRDHGLSPIRENAPLITRNYQKSSKEGVPWGSCLASFFILVTGWLLFGIAGVLLLKQGRQLDIDNPRSNLTDEEIEQQERLRYRNGGMVWGVPNAYKHCTAYNNRTYTARLYNIPKGYDLKKSCKYTPITIYDQTFEEPAMCFTEGSWNSIHGLWHVEDIRCRPHWGPPSDRGCTGLGSGSRRVESRLWGLRNGEDWFALCETTPITLYNEYIERPTYCESRGLFQGFWGIWDLEDEACTSFAPADFEEFETVDSNAGEAEPGVLPEDSEAISSGTDLPKEDDERNPAVHA